MLHSENQLVKTAKLSVESARASTGQGNIKAEVEKCKQFLKSQGEKYYELKRDVAKKITPNITVSNYIDHLPDEEKEFLQLARKELEYRRSLSSGSNQLTECINIMKQELNESMKFMAEVVEIVKESNANIKIN